MRYTSLMAATAAITAALLTSCLPAPEADEIDPSQPSTEDAPLTKPVTFTLSGDFVTEYHTRAPLTADGNMLTDLWVIDTDTETGAVLQSLLQKGADADFGQPSLDLTFGQHTLYFCASRGSEPVWSDDKLSISWGKARDTFWCTYPLTVAQSTTSNHTAELARAVSRLAVRITDKVPAAAATLRITLTRGSDAIALLTGHSPSASTMVRTFSCMADAGSVVNDEWTVFTLCPSSEEWLNDVTLAYLDASDAVLCSRTVEGVKLLQNRETLLTGRMVDASNAFSLSLSTGWDEGVSQTF